MLLEERDLRLVASGERLGALDHRGAESHQRRLDVAAAYRCGDARLARIQAHAQGGRLRTTGGFEAIKERLDAHAANRMRFHAVTHMGRQRRTREAGLGSSPARRRNASKMRGPSGVR